MVTPTEPTEPQTPTAEPVKEGEEAEPTEATPTEPELYELPDGRKVTGSELRRLYADELLPEFTRRSQELAKYQDPQKQNQPQATAQPKEPWVPQSYDEILEKAKEAVLGELTSRQQMEQQAREQLADSIDSQVTELKKTEPNLNENQLFQHATKYGFGDLKLAYQNMKDMNLVVQATEQRVQKNLANRAGTPIAGNAKSGTAPGEGIEYNPYGPKETPQEALRRMNQN